MTTISGNKFTTDNQSAVTPEHCIVSGAARNVKISSNLFEASSLISAIVFDSSNTPSVNVHSGVAQVLGNTANSNRAVGINLLTTNSQITGNKATSNDGDGIQVLSTATGNTLSGNVAMGNGDAFGGFDLDDLTTGGTGTAGTKNTWSGNKFKTSNPAGLK